MDPHGSPSNAAAACSFPSACRAAARRGVVVKKVGLGTLGKGKPWENLGSCDFSNFENWLEKFGTQKHKISCKTSLQSIHGLGASWLDELQAKVADQVEGDGRLIV